MPPRRPRHVGIVGLDVVERPRAGVEAERRTRSQRCGRGRRRCDGSGVAGRRPEGSSSAAARRARRAGVGGASTGSAAARAAALRRSSAGQRRGRPPTAQRCRAPRAEPRPGRRRGRDAAGLGRFDEPRDDRCGRGDSRGASTVRPAATASADGEQATRRARRRPPRARPRRSELTSPGPARTVAGGGDAPPPRRAESLRQHLAPADPLGRSVLGVVRSSIVLPTTLVRRGDDAAHRRGSRQPRRGDVDTVKPTMSALATETETRPRAAGAPQAGPEVDLVEPAVAAADAGADLRHVAGDDQRRRAQLHLDVDPLAGSGGR